MGSTLSLTHLRGLTSGNDANTIYLDSGHDFHAPGHVIQVVQGTFGGYDTITSTTLTNTSLNATITPKFSTSKILVKASFLFGQTRSAQNQDNMKYFTIKRGSTNIAPHNSRFFAHQNEASGSIDFNEQTQVATIEYLDSPTTTSATTYTLACSCDNSGVTISLNGRGYGSGQEGSCTMILQEIAQ